MNSPINLESWSVYDYNGDRVDTYTGANARGQARRRAAVLSSGHSHCTDRGPNRWTSTDVVEDFYNALDTIPDVETTDWEEDEDTEVEPPEDVYEARKENIQKENEILKSVGIVPSGLYVSRGSATEDSRRLRNAKYELLPLVVDGPLLDVAEVIDAEERADNLIEIRNLRMMADGMLINLEGAKTLGPIERRAFTQLLQRIGVFPSAAPFLNSIPTFIMVDTFNRVMKYYSNAGHFKSDRSETGYKRISIGTRYNTAINARSVYRAVSTSYQGGLDCADVLRAAHQSLVNLEGRADIAYNPESTRLQIDVIWQKGYKTKSIDNWERNPMCEGSVFQFGLRITSADAANHRFLVQAIARRDGCDNCAVILTEKGFLVEKRHIGDLEIIYNAMFGGDNELGAVQETLELVEPMLHQWGYLESTPINQVKLWGQYFRDTHDRDEDGTFINKRSAAENALRWAVKAGKIGKGQSKKALLDYLLTGLSKEPSPCLDSIVNAITRAAHESLLEDIVRDQLEREAGALVPVLASRM